MSDNIKDKKKNYKEVEQLLSFNYKEVDGVDFKVILNVFLYSAIFGGLVASAYYFIN